VNKVFLVELTGTLGKFAMADPSFAGGIPIDADIVRGVHKDNNRASVDHQAVESSLRRCIPAMNVVATELPDIAHLANLNPCRRAGIIDIVDRGLTEFLDRQVDLGQAEPSDRKIEILVKLLQLEETLSEQTLVPVTMLR
jgi:hypothetical protein